MRQIAVLQHRLETGVLGACGVLSALIAARELDPARPLWFAAAVGTVVVTIAATGVGTYRRARGSLLMLVFSPYGVAAATWVLLFVYRPVELYASPDHAARSVAQLGFSLGDLTRTVALAGLGCAAWGIGYLLALGRPDPRPRMSPTIPAAFSSTGTAVAIAVGTALWLLLFVRQGGISALIESAASIRVNQLSSSYGFVGVWIVQGVALYALLSLLRGARQASWALLASAPLVVLAAVALQLRLLAALAVLSAVCLYLVSRGVTRRLGVLLAVLAVVGTLGLAFFQQVREYSIFVPTRQAISLTWETPIDATLVSDLSTYDNFVAIQNLVPDSIAYLDGRTILQIPQAFVPRALWPDKPLGIDFLTSSYLYPGVFVAIPISIQGELYWNGGLLAVALGSLVLGLLLGLVGRLGLRVTRRSELFLLYALVFPFTHAFLTRGLATMLENLAFALIGVGTAVLAMNPELRRRFVAGLRTAVSA